jgi:hypothetical protein
MTPSQDFLSTVLIPAIKGAARIAAPGVALIDAGHSLRHREALLEAMTGAVVDAVAEKLHEVGMDSPSFIAACQAEALTAFAAELQRLRTGGGRA